VEKWNWQEVVEVGPIEIEGQAEAQSAVNSFRPVAGEVSPA